MSELMQICGVDVDLLPEPYRTQVHHRYARLLAASEQGIFLTGADERLLRRVCQWILDYQTYFGKSPGAS